MRVAVDGESVQLYEAFALLFGVVLRISAQVRFYSCGQLKGIERLCNVVVRAEGKPRNFVNMRFLLFFVDFIANTPDCFNIARIP